MSTGSIPPIEKLKGRENFDTWKFAVKSYLEHEELWGCVDGTETDSKKVTKAKSKIVLLIEPINYVHVQSATTAKEAWESLNRAFEDNGLTRRVGLLRTLITTRLDDSNSVEEYVNKIVSTAHKLSSVGLKVSEEWIGTILLAGLPEEYKPMIMGIESSGVAVTGDSIKTKLLQDVKSNTKQVAMYSGFKKKVKVGSGSVANKNKNVRCYKCNRYGHFAKSCDSQEKPKQNKEVALFSALSVAPRGDKSKSDWFVDSAATIHMTNNLEVLQDVQNTFDHNISTANDQVMCADKVGNVVLPVSNTYNATIKNTVYVPDLKANLLSVSQIVKKNCSVLFDSVGCKIYDSQKHVIATAKLEKDLFKLDLVDCTNTSNNFACHVSVENSKVLWHRRLGHINYTNLNKLKNGLASGIDFNDKDLVCKCEVCIQGKCHRLPFKDSDSQTKNVLELVHSDLCGPIESKSIVGSQYMLTFLDDYTHKVFVYFLKRKSEVFDCFKIFKKFVENQSGRSIKILRTDNGGEFIGTNFQNFLKDSGILHQLTVPYTAEQNGKAERLNRTIIEKTRCLLIDSELPNSFWAEAANTSVYLLNRSPTKCLLGKTPEEAWSGVKPKLEGLRIFGCKVHSHIPKDNRKKLDRKTIASIFIGYSTESKGYRLYNPSNGKVYISRDIVFFEQEKGSMLIENSRAKNEKHFFVFPENSTEPQIEHEVEPEPQVNPNVIEPIENNIDFEQESSSTYSSASEGEASIIDEEYIPLENVEIPKEVRRSEREKRPPRNLDDYDVSYATMVDFSDPETVEEALSRPDSNQWRSAMKEEYSALLENKTWELVDYSADKKPLKCKWVFKVKKDASGRIVKHKARLVIKGCSQKKGIDYKETYSPVVRYTTIRYLLAIAAEYDLDIDQLDAVTAFLQGELTEEIYMLQPEGFAEPNKICKLHKSLYGLKQASRIWNLKLDDCLKKCGLIQSKTDSCIYYRMTEDIILIVAIYVDDMIIFSNNVKAKTSLKNELMSQFKMKDIGEARFVLGMQIIRDRKNNKLWLDQQLYIEEILKRYKMWDCNPVDSPVLLGEKLSKNMSPKSEDEIEKMSHVPYQEAIGSLLFAAQVSRPDISFAVNNVSRFTQNPGSVHWTATKRIMRYLRGTTQYKLEFDGLKRSSIIGFTDADWASNVDDRRSVTGYVFLKNGTAISWATRRQSTVALSTTESEYMAMSMAAQEALWLRGLSEELEQSRGPTLLYVDNQGAQNLAVNGAYHARTKHIDVRHHFLKEKINNGLLELKYISTDRQVADSLTKAVDKKKTQLCARNQGLKYFK